VVPGRSALDWADATGVTGALLTELDARAARRRRQRRATGAAAALLLVAALVGFELLPDRADPTAVVMRPTQHRLPDGSTVELRDGAAITHDFSGPTRAVVLQRGEAHFAVAPDSRRPFVVTAAGVAVRAVGTAFSVNVGTADIAVLVTEGRVTVEAPAGPAPAAEPPVMVGAGQQAVVTRAGEIPRPAAPRVTAPTAADISAQLAWRVPRLELSGTRLSEVVRLFNEHGTVRFKIGDSELKRLEVSGLIRADNPEALVEVLAANYNVVARPDEAGRLRLERRR
jgi:transmembrane sensor